MMIRCNVTHLRPGDVVTGAWSERRNRYDPVVHFVKRFTERYTAPDGTPIAIVHGAQEWQAAHYAADTIVRVRRG